MEWFDAGNNNSVIVFAHAATRIRGAAFGSSDGPDGGVAFVGFGGARVEEVDENAFGRDNRLTEVWLPRAKRIGPGNYFTQATRIYAPECREWQGLVHAPRNTRWYETNWVDTNGISRTMTKYYPPTNSVLEWVELGVEYLDSHAFEGCVSMHSAFLPNLQESGYGTFIGCTNLAIVYAPKQRIGGERQHYGNTRLAQGYFSSMEIIGDEMFKGCTNFTRVVDAWPDGMRIGNPWRWTTAKSIPTGEYPDGYEYIVIPTNDANVWGNKNMPAAGIGYNFRAIPSWESGMPLNMRPQERIIYVPSAWYFGRGSFENTGTEIISSKRAKEFAGSAFRGALNLRSVTAENLEVLGASALRMSARGESNTNYVNLTIPSVRWMKEHALRDIKLQKWVVYGGDPDHRPPGTVPGRLASTPLSFPYLQRIDDGALYGVGDVGVLKIPATVQMATNATDNANIGKIEYIIAGESASLSDEDVLRMINDVGVEASRDDGVSAIRGYDKVIEFDSGDVAGDWSFLDYINFYNAPMINGNDIATVDDVNDSVSDRLFVRGSANSTNIPWEKFGYVGSEGYYFAGTFGDLAITNNPEWPPYGAMNDDPAPALTLRHDTIVAGIQASGPDGEARLFAGTLNDSGAVEISEMLPFGAIRDALLHTSNTNNPHKVTAAQVGAMQGGAAGDKYIIESLLPRYGYQANYDYPGEGVEKLSGFGHNLSFEESLWEGPGMEIQFTPTIYGVDVATVDDVAAVDGKLDVLQDNLDTVAGDLDHWASETLGKQDQLTAGDNIIISNNVISSAITNVWMHGDTVTNALDEVARQQATNAAFPTSPEFEYVWKSIWQGGTNSRRGGYTLTVPAFWGGTQPAGLDAFSSLYLLRNMDTIGGFGVIGETNSPIYTNGLVFVEGTLDSLDNPGNFNTLRLKDVAQKEDIDKVLETMNGYIPWSTNGNRVVDLPMFFGTSSAFVSEDGLVKLIVPAIQLTGTPEIITNWSQIKGGSVGSITNLGYGLTGDGMSTPLAVDMNIVASVTDVDVVAQNLTMLQDSLDVVASDVDWWASETQGKQNALTAGNHIIISNNAISADLTGYATTTMLTNYAPISSIMDLEQRLVVLEAFIPSNSIGGEIGNPDLPGALKITFVPEVSGAQWSADYGVTWKSGGTQVSGLAQSLYTVFFKDVAWYNTPVATNVAVLGGYTNNLVIPYVPLGKIGFTNNNLGVKISWDGSTWYGANTNTSNAATNYYVPVGQQTFTFSDIPKYKTPEPITTTIMFKTTNVLSYRYIPSWIQPSFTPSMIGGGAIVNGTQFTNKTQFAPGTYTVEFADVAHYITPEPQTVTAEDDQTTTVHGVYVYRPSIRVICGTNGLWSIDNENWHPSGTTVYDLVDGNQYTVFFAEIDGYGTPLPYTFTATLDTAHTLTRYYSADQSYLKISVEPAAVQSVKKPTINGISYGTSWNYAKSVAVGTNTVTYADFSTNWATPDPVMITCAKNETNILVGTYREKGIVVVDVVAYNPQGGTTFQYSIDNGTTWTRAGTNRVPPGTHTMLFSTSATNLFLAPQPQQVIVGEGLTTNVYVEFLNRPQDVIVNLDDDAVAAGAKWSIDGGVTWLNSGYVYKSNRETGLVITFKPLGDETFITPEPIATGTMWGGVTRSISYARKGYVQVQHSAPTLLPETYRWTIDDGETWNTGDGSVLLPVGNHYARFDHASSRQYCAPFSQVVTVRSGETSLVEVVYRGYGYLKLVSSGQILAPGKWNGHVFDTAAQYLEGSVPLTFTSSYAGYFVPTNKTASVTPWVTNTLSVTYVEGGNLGVYATVQGVNNSGQNVDWCIANNVRYSDNGGMSWNPLDQTREYMGGIPPYNYYFTTHLVRPGTYTLRFSGVEGYAKPDDITATVEAGGATYVTGVYIP